MDQAMRAFGLVTGHCTTYYNATANHVCPLDLCLGAPLQLKRRLCAYLRQPEPKDPSVFRIFDGLDAVFDSPVPNFFPYLWRAYPTARVILTQREPAAWYRSRSKHHHNPQPPQRHSGRWQQQRPVGLRL